MANSITDETIEYVGILAKLELSAQEQIQAQKDMERMLNFIDKLNELDTSGTEPMSHIYQTYNVFRDDVVENGNVGGYILANAPAVNEGAFKVPRTVNQEGVR